MPSAPELAAGGAGKPDDGVAPFVCPRGHYNIQMGAHRFQCGTCRRAGHDVRAWDKDELVDLREEEPPLAEGTDDGDDEDLIEGAGDLFVSYYPGPTDKIFLSKALRDALGSNAVRLFSKDNKAAFVPCDGGHPNAYPVHEGGHMSAGWAKYELDVGDPDRGRYRVAEDEDGVWIVEFDEPDETVAGNGVTVDGE